MSVATLPPEALTAFEMPRPMCGQQVLFYQHASPTEQPLIGFVLRVSRNSIELEARGMAYATVRHVSDPKLNLNDHQKMNGAWDFTELDREVPKMRQQIADLQKRVAALEEKPRKQG